MLRLGNLGFFWKELSTTERPVLFLDYDGTLAPFRTERDEAAPYPGVVEWLDTIAGDTETRLVLVSGRIPEEVEALLGLAHRIEVWGAHGLERRRADGTVERVELSPAAERALERAEALAVQMAQPLPSNFMSLTTPSSTARYIVTRSPQSGLKPSELWLAPSSVP